MHSNGGTDINGEELVPRGGDMSINAGTDSNGGTGMAINRGMDSIGGTDINGEESLPRGGDVDSNRGVDGNGSADMNGEELVHTSGMNIIGGTDMAAAWTATAARTSTGRSLYPAAGT